MSAINTKNKISVFASGASISGSATHSQNEGYVYDDTTWAGLSLRENGALEGIASSQVYNTALKQATTMASVLADVLSIRNSANSTYAYENTYGIGTAFDQSEQNIDKHVNNLAKIFNNGNFLFNGEVITSKISDSAVTTQKIANNSITYGKLGDLINVSGGVSSSSNNMTVKLYQDSNKGQLKISLTGSTVTNSVNVNHLGPTTSQVYLWGSSSYSSGNRQPQSNNQVYMSNGRLYSNGLTSSNSVSISGTVSASGKISSTVSVEAPYFNATSDIRLKTNLTGINYDGVRDIVENTDLFEFNYTNSDEKVIGIIAQDVKNKYIGEFNLVNENEDGFLTVKESKIPYILWGYIKLLKQEIEELKSKIK